MSENKILKLGEILLEEGLITHDQLLAALKAQKTDSRKLGEILVSQGVIEEQKVVRALSRIYNLPFVNLADVQIDPNVFQAISLNDARKFQVIPIRVENGDLILATADPLDVASFQEIQYITGLQIKPVMASLTDIIESFDKVGAMASHHPRTKYAGSDDTEASASVIQLVEDIIAGAIKERASDIHLEPLEDRLQIRYRIDGVLYERKYVPKELERKTISRLKIIAGMDVADSRKPQDGRITLPTKFEDFDIRVSTLPNIYGENMVLRLLDKSSKKFSLESLGMAKEEIEIVEKLITRPHGMLLVTGPTGAGKSTTLYSILKILNQPTKNIITVEDPVEYKMRGINQTSINTRAGYTFATAIRHILRHDPDIIMVGEIRDQETAEIAIRSALTGHLVLSTLHTNTAAGAIMRLKDMGIEPFLIRSAVFGAIAQRLVRKLCPNCKEEYTLSKEQCQSIEQLRDLPAPPVLARPKGCDRCFQTGYSGRLGIFEILQVNDAVRNKILESPNEAEIAELGRANGMKSLRIAGIEKALKKETSLEEVLRTTFAEGE